jgi:hypothetical protein
MRNVLYLRLYSEIEFNYFEVGGEVTLAMQMMFFVCLDVHFMENSMR